ncbi:hypothetical protein GCE86_18420 [Micromonospora terminaliae]|uniref:Uncharacterized protein n=1 Tax=Micromonospora terminaliae TaxID=1914461 RepID=A0AAJ2ZFY7_9ACTN|nr:hypothetical protein [Micromonospora terminaliae]NES29188.1 hypothetical protein [Micromonospora terminaliae]QGL48817.1 hypothetical protein GCE86_18420 [Micromonospora terminaliae]
MSTLSSAQLLKSSQEWGRRAFVSYLTNDRSALLIDAAVSLEHLSKAYLYGQHPALLIDLGKKDFDSLLHLCSLSKHARRPRMATISGTEAFNRVQILLPNMKTSAASIKTLIEVRDGTIHAGQLPPGDITSTFASFVRASAEICEALGIDLEDHWAEHKALADSLASDSITKIEQRVSELIAAAKLRFKALTDSIPQGEQAGIFEAMRAAIEGALLGDEVEESPCPSCSQAAYCSGKYEVDYDVDVDVDDGIAVAYPANTLLFYPAMLTCGVCKLFLKDRDELKAAGVNQTWEIDDPELLGEYMDRDQGLMPSPTEV